MISVLPDVPNFARFRSRLQAGFVCMRKNCPETSEKNRKGRFQENAIDINWLGVISDGLHVA